MCYLNPETKYLNINIIDFLEKHKKLINKGKLENYFPSIKPKKDFEFMVYGLKENNKGEKITSEKILGSIITYWNKQI